MRYPAADVLSARSGANGIDVEFLWLEGFRQDGRSASVLIGAIVVTVLVIAVIVVRSSFEES